MKRIRVAHFGIAHDHSGVTMDCVRSHPDVFEVVAVCEPDEETRAKFGGDAVYEGIPWITEEELLSRKDIDAVLCEGNELRSVSDAQKCIDHGMHVHLDKPGGTDLAAFEKLIRDAERKGLTLQMGYMYRYNPAMRYVLKSVREGKLGAITGIDATFCCRHTSEKRRWLKQFPGGMMFFLGCHSIDMILQINGLPQRVVPFNRSSGFENDGSLDTAFAVLDYPNGVCTVRSNATECNGYSHRRLLVVGTKGTIDICPLESPTLVRETTQKHAEELGWRDASDGVFPGFLSSRYDDMMLEFAACVRGEMKNPYTGDYEIELQRIVLEACK